MSKLCLDRPISQQISLVALIWVQYGAEYDRSPRMTDRDPRLKSAQKIISLHQSGLLWSWNSSPIYLAPFVSFPRHALCSLLPGGALRTMFAVVLVFGGGPTIHICLPSQKDSKKRKESAGCRWPRDKNQIAKVGFLQELKRRTNSFPQISGKRRH